MDETKDKNDIEFVRNQLKELFQFAIYRLDNNQCTPAEIRSASRLIEGSLEINSSIRDIAEFFGQPEGNVRSVINRKLLAKPKRVVLYPFIKFLKIVPERWYKR